MPSYRKRDPGDVGFRKIADLLHEICGKAIRPFRYQSISYTLRRNAAKRCPGGPGRKDPALEKTDLDTIKRSLCAHQTTAVTSTHPDGLGLDQT